MHNYSEKYRHFSSSRHKKYGRALHPPTTRKKTSKHHNIILFSSYLIQPVVGTLPRNINTNNMNMSRTSSSQPQKDLYVYKAPWTIFGTAWSERKDQPFRLALGSFIEEYANKVSIVQLNEQSNEFKHVTTFEHPYPTTKIQWYPSSATTASDLLVTSGDYLRLYQVQETSVVKQSVFNNVCACLIGVILLILLFASMRDFCTDTKQTCN